MKAVLLAAVLAASRCTPPPPTPVPEPLPGEFTCRDACAQFRHLGCEEAEPTPEGATCVEFCGVAQEGPAPLNLGCIVRANSCDQARRCE
jgi:hypothetical protein